jgi:hypothetical protein
MASSAERKKESPSKPEIGQRHKKSFGGWEAEEEITEGVAAVTLADDRARSFVQTRFAKKRAIPVSEVRRNISSLSIRRNNPWFFFSHRPKTD